MPTIARNLLILLTVGFVAFVAIPLARSLLLDSFVVGRTFHSSNAWLNPLTFFEWLFYLLAFVPLGYALSRWVASSRPWAWAWALGILYGCLLVATTQHYFFSTTTLSAYVMVYGAYLMPLVGALAGHLLQVATQRQQTGA